MIFTSVRTEGDNGYGAMADELERLMKDQPGFVSMESARGADGAGITVCYWSSMEAIAAWKALPIHREAQARGRAEWYRSYQVRVCRVEREYGFPEGA
ncbi:MAG TPA: antibiotic biosynthesis monooxygenase [Myxococcaceae bacterium]